MEIFLNESAGRMQDRKGSCLEQIIMMTDCCSWGDINTTLYRTVAEISKGEP
jgi:hypothetical protein